MVWENAKIFNVRSEPLAAVQGVPLRFADSVFLCVTLLARSIGLLMEIWHDGCHLSVFIRIYPIIYSILS